MSRYVFFITKLGHGGAERVATIVANEFAKNPDNDIHVILTYDSESSYSLNKNITVHSLPFSKIHFVRICKRQVAVHKLLKQIRPDVVISIPQGSSPYIAMDLYFNKSYKAVFSQRQDPELLYTSKLKKYFGNFIYNRADKVVFQTEQQRKFFKKSVQNKGIIILNPIMENLPLREQDKISNEIVTFCRLEKEKNLDMLIEAFSEVIKKYPDHCLKIFGKGSMETELREKIKHLGLEGKASLEDYSSDIHEKIKNAFMYVNSSDHEGISNAMLESMAIGLPVVCTDCPCGGARMIIKNEQNGMLVPVNDKDALRKAMEKVISDNTLRKNISKEASKLKDELKQEKIVGKWKELIESI